MKCYIDDRQVDMSLFTLKHFTWGYLQPRVIFIDSVNMLIGRMSNEVTSSYVNHYLLHQLYPFLQSQKGSAYSVSDEMTIMEETCKHYYEYHSEIRV